MAKRPAKTEVAKVINKDRMAAMKKYLAPNQIDENTEQLAMQELILHEKPIEFLNNYAFEELFEKGKPNAKVIRDLASVHSMSTLAATHIVRSLTREIGESFNPKTEFTQLFYQMNNNMAMLQEILTQVAEDGADTDLDPASLLAEMRAWFTLKGNLLNNAGSQHLQAQAVSIEKEKADRLNGMSNEDLIKAIGAL